MIRNSIFALVAVLTPLGVAAVEKPLWEVVARIDGKEETSQIENYLKEFFGGMDTAGPLGTNVVVRFAGFENAATAEEDWVAEIDGLADANGLIKQLGESGKIDAQGRIIIGEEGASFTVWRDGDSGLRLAGPPASSDVSVSAVAELKTGEALAGWVDLSRLERDSISSQSLKLPENLRYSMTAIGDEISLEIIAEMANVELVQTTRKLLEEMHAELADKAQSGQVSAPKFVISAEGTQITLKVTTQAGDFESLLGEVNQVIGEP